MIYVSPVEALYQELPWEPEVLANLQSLFINVFGRKIFSDTAVISVAQLNFIVFMVEQVGCPVLSYRPHSHSCLKIIIKIIIL